VRYLGELVDLGFVDVVNVAQQVRLVGDEYHGQVFPVGELHLVVHVVLPLLRALYNDEGDGDDDQEESVGRWNEGARARCRVSVSVAYLERSLQISAGVDYHKRTHGVAVVDPGQAAKSLLTCT
jgi:hypothetical protein